MGETHPRRRARELKAKRDRNGHYHCEYTRFETRTQCSHVSPFVLLNFEIKKNF